MGNGKEEDGGKVRLNPECPLTSQQPVGRLGPSCSGRGMLSRSRRHGRTCVEGCRRWHKVGGAGCHGGCVAEGRETTARPRASGLARLYTRIHALLAGERRLGRLGPWLQDCWSVSSRDSWPGSFDSGWWWVCAWRPCGVVDRCHCSPLVTRRDATRGIEGWPPAVMDTWVSVCMYRHCADVGAGVVGSKVQCGAVSPVSPRLDRSNKCHHASLIAECRLQHGWATHQHRVQKAPCLFFYRCH
jgi:hypothetical protein